MAFSRDADWCSTGGCTLVVLEAIPDKDQDELGPFVVAAEVARVDGTVRMLDKTTHGWADLAVTDEEGQSVRLAFTGETYPFSPTGGTADDTVTVNSGQVLFAGDK
ncbi:MAG: hypothetical protein AAGI52_04060 [Bacteroidota bacterium]